MSGGLPGALSELTRAIGREFRKVHSTLERIEANTDQGQAHTLARVRELVDQWSQAKSSPEGMTTGEAAILREAARVLSEVLDGTRDRGIDE